MLFMIIERFKNSDPVPVYRRFRDRGRLVPEGVGYVSSWVDESLERCFQIMETHDRRLLDELIEILKAVLVTGDGDRGFRFLKNSAQTRRLGQSARFDDQHVR